MTTIRPIAVNEFYPRNGYSDRARFELLDKVLPRGEP